MTVQFGSNLSDVHDVVVVDYTCFVLLVSLCFYRLRSPSYLSLQNMLSGTSLHRSAFFTRLKENIFIINILKVRSLAMAPAPLPDRAVNKIQF
jgi:hypothetical protein